METVQNGLSKGEAIPLVGVVVSSMKVIVSFGQFGWGLITADPTQIGLATKHFGYSVGNMASIGFLDYLTEYTNIEATT
jgi:hypothetical protein